MKLLKCAAVDMPDWNAGEELDLDRASKCCIPLHQIEAVGMYEYDTIDSDELRSYVVVDTLSSAFIIVAGPDFETLVSMLENA